MGISFRHVVWGSATLALGAFFYVLTLEPMDSKMAPRAAALDRSPTQADLIGAIRRSMARGQLPMAQHQAEVLYAMDPGDPDALFYRAIVARVTGRESIERESWEKLYELTHPGENGGELAPNDGYYAAWSSVGVDEQDQGKSEFRRLGDRYQARNHAGQGLGVIASYNLACYRSMSGQTDLALAHWAQAVEQGYGKGDRGDEGWWMIDPDLEPLREQDAFWEIARPLMLERRNERDPRSPTGDDPSGPDAHEPAGDG